MAVATITRVNGSENVNGKRRGMALKVVGPTTYVAGGIPITPSQAGCKVLLHGIVNAGNAAAAGLLAQFDPVNNVLRVMYPSGGGAASPAALADPAITAGAVAMTSNAANGAADLTPGRGKEVAVNTDLSSCTWIVDLEGY